MSRGGRWRWALVALGLAAAAGQAVLSADAPASSPAAASTVDIDPVAGAEALEELTVGDVSVDGGYDRAAFGQAWSDDVDVAGGHNGCDTRNDVLRRDLREVEARAGTNGCVVVAGRLEPEPYTGEARTFTKARAYELQVDHVFPLAAAWSAGARGWSDDRRRNFANDPLNLLVVDGPLNQAKGASTPAEWMPPNPAVRCAYAQRYALVATTYDLVVSPADRDRLVGACES